MLLRRVVCRELSTLHHVIASTSISKITVNLFCSIGEDMYSDVPRPGKKWERKAYLTPMKTLIRRAKSKKLVQKENPCRIIEHAPDNGLLLPDLVDVARHVYRARESLLRGLSLLFHLYADAICIHRCRYFSSSSSFSYSALLKKLLLARFCREVHIGQKGHEIKTCEGSKGASRNALHVWRRGGIRDIIYFPKCYHIYDRAMNPRVGHKERFEIPRVPAVVELCIQAGLDLQDYPTKRRRKPVYSIEGRVVDFDPTEDDDGQSLTTTTDANNNTIIMFNEKETMSELGTKTLQSWLEMKTGVEEMMKKYVTLTCGYCTTVQVGPKGHKVRRCKATGHQYRDGLHAWQEASVDDLIGPNYVWHVSSSDLGRSPLDNELKRFYGKAPAVVELCVQMGAPVPPQYMSMMRLDVVAPSRDEYDLVA